MSSTYNLAEKKCVACHKDASRLKGKELESFFNQLETGWKIETEGHLEKEYLFPNFKQALSFTNEIGKIAENEGHHPDIHLSWGRVKIVLWTHQIHGLSENDFILASKCDEVYAIRHFQNQI